MSSTTMSGRPRRRAVEACTFCRKRKIKCNNEQPTCANCRTYGKDCVYEPLASPASSSGNPAASGTAAARNSRRKSRPPSSQPGGPDVKVRSETTPPEDTHAYPALGSHEPEPRSGPTPKSPDETPQGRPDVRRNGVSRIVVSANGVSTYHGRTSTLFEENLQDRATADHPSLPDEWIEKSLVAEAARQRQLEQYHYSTGMLDFDGVEPELAMHLLSLHWNRQHHSFLLTYRAAFMRDMACNGPYFSKLLLNAIYFGASKFSPRLEVRRDPNDVRTAGWQFRQRVRQLLGTALDRSEITTIQALLVMTNSLFALGDERSAAWLYAGLAFRMIIDLGMHVDATDLGIPKRFSDEDLEIRRRVFWGAFVVDKIQSLYQGRPVTLKESDTLVPIKFLDTYEEFEHWTPFAYSTQSVSYPGSPAYSVSTFTSLCRLAVVMSDILGSIYTERSFSESAVKLSAVLESLNSKLADWKSNLPRHLNFDPKEFTKVPPPHVLSLHAMYHVLTILLHRPFVADGHLYNTSRSVSVNSLITCASSASTIVSLLRAYDKAFSVKRAPYLISYATYVAATIHVRIAAKSSSESEAHYSLQACLDVFEENSATNSAVKRANVIVRKLMERLGVTSLKTDKGLKNHDPKLMSNEVSRPLPQIPPAGNQTGNTMGPPSSNQFPGEADYGTPQTNWSDIDGIIQSFLGGQDGAFGGEGEQPTDLEHMESLPAPQYQEVAGAHVPMNEAYGGGGPIKIGDNGGSIEDLLFGFNGSALDSFLM
ncbi:fungal-specific transcription factor domain-containing protein [Stachybotrys elegans]|uniref:Fungal-specific transcription factor domain-containing protein n=1 Tax=Stachybotrys elegans TaxID=80388 RepID=A0A8K0SHN0_9HYPO|nr:fungal-specific transcription factor domain-containing protein [Stachybotrys elegans]